MDPLSPDADNKYNIRRSENNARFDRRYDTYDTYNQTRTDYRLPNHQNNDRNNQNNSYTYTRQQPNDDAQSAGSRRFQNNRQDDERERANVSHRPQTRFVTDNNQEINRRSQLPDQIQRSPRVDYTVNQNQSGNPRNTIVLDINITISIPGSRNPQITTTTNTVPLRSLPIRSTAVIEDVGYVDLHVRSPERTARLATDGLIQSSPSRQSTTLPNENNK